MVRKKQGRRHNYAVTFFSIFNIFDMRLKLIEDKKTSIRVSKETLKEFNSEKKLKPNGRVETGEELIKRLLKREKTSDRSFARG